MTATVALLAALDVAPNLLFATDQTPEGVVTLQRRLEQTEVAPTGTLVVMEAPGAYWISLATTLVAAGFAVSVINPKQAHDFANACSNGPKPMPSSPDPRPTCCHAAAHALDAPAGDL